MHVQECLSDCFLHYDRVLVDGCEEVGPGCGKGFLECCGGRINTVCWADDGVNGFYFIRTARMSSVVMMC